MLRQISRPAIGFLCLALCSGVAAAQAAHPAPILPKSLQWFSPPGIPSLRGAWVVGSEQNAGLYVLRVMLDEGGRIPAHAHPDTRHSTVLSGTLYVAFGDSAGEADWIAVPAGAVYVAPAGVLHALWARDGDVVYQESGMGPTAIIPAAQP
jgi:quercetin dioxygenase-like cupin family protein